MVPQVRGTVYQASTFPAHDVVPELTRYLSSSQDCVEQCNLVLGRPLASVRQVLRSHQYLVARAKYPQTPVRRGPVYK